ncbi:MAG: HlyD family type I secretion periplasmic adaptor subunit [Gammaproteobacteria bacterium]|nr:HlyD family type I secretion periplasmic adaptor subunit [Gammaproteobacteria bacterium]
MARHSRDYDFLPSIVAVMERPPAFYTRIVSALVILLAVIAGSWAFFSKTDIVVSAQGEIVPDGRVKVVQAAEQGIVRKIFVDDGKVVEAGDKLIELDGTTSRAEQMRLRIERDRALLKVQRLRTELGQPVELGAGTDLSPGVIETERDLYQANERHFADTVAQLANKRREAHAAREVSRRQADKLRTQISHLQSTLARKRTQADKGLIPGQEAEDVEFELQAARKELRVQEEKTQQSEIRLHAAKEKMESAALERRSRLLRELATAEHELQSVEQELVKAGHRLKGQAVQAPVSGVVQQLSVHTLGAFVQRGEQLLVIVPEGVGLQMDATILNKDIGFVESGHPARVKVDAFEFTRYGHIDGRLQWVGSDAMVDEQKGPVYPARVSLSSTSLPNRTGTHDAVVVPGMQATADIVIGQRRLMEYFIAPLLRYRDESLRER